MPKFLLTLESEEIPASMQQPAAEALSQILSSRLEALMPRNCRTFWGPRRIGVSLTIEAVEPARAHSERGPRVEAPDVALNGFLRKHQARREDLTSENGFWVLNQTYPEVSAATRLAEILPEILWSFSWPKSMRWGSGSAFTWVRPLRRIIAIMDGKTVPFNLARHGDDGHGLASGHISEGHRFLSPDSFTVSSLESYRVGLEAHHVLLDADARADAIRAGLKKAVGEAGVTLVEDEGLLQEITGLTEWPVPMLGRIDASFMELPPEVMQVSMRINQRYFATRSQDGGAAPYFAFVANQTFPDGGKATIAGNERVLRARFSDAWHFWQLDRQAPLASRVAKLDSVTFHKALGSVGARVQRMVKLAGLIAGQLSLTADEKRNAERAALLAKADLTSGMVGEFPELQGVMGGYYAKHDGEEPAVAEAVGTHYQPRGLNDETPTAPVAMAVALTDRIDVLSGFFAIGETPSGSGDPYALRRAALGIVRIIRDNALRLDLKQIFEAAVTLQPVSCDVGVVTSELLDFLAERLRVQLRSEGKRHDVLTALMTPARKRDILDLLARVDAMSSMIETDDGSNLLAASKRAANILRVENKKDGPHTAPPQPTLYKDEAEISLAEILTDVASRLEVTLRNEDYTAAMREAASLRPCLDRFFTEVTVNDPDEKIRANRLRLLHHLNEVLGSIANFSEIGR